MISLIIHHDPLVRDAFVRALALEKKEETIHETTYQHGKWIFIFTKIPLTGVRLSHLVELYQSERVYLPSFGRSIDLTHEEGDIVLPNVFLRYNPTILTTNVDQSNRDSFMGSARFLEIYDDQRDYYVEDFWLSIGGIVVSNTPEMDTQEHLDILMMVYEADVYLMEDIDTHVNLVLDDIVPTIITIGIIQWKKTQTMPDSPLDTTVRNMITTWRLMEEEL